ncbi:hypothetical protein [Thalassiella azotivora]
MSEQSQGAQRQAFQVTEEAPGGDDGTQAPDAAMADPDRQAPDPQQADPGGYPHAPSPDVPSIPTDTGREKREAGTPTGADVPADAPGPGRDTAQTTPEDEDERRKRGNA